MARKKKTIDIYEKLPSHLPNDVSIIRLLGDGYETAKEIIVWIKERYNVRIVITANDTMNQTLKGIVETTDNGVPSVTIAVVTNANTEHPTNDTIAIMQCIQRNEPIILINDTKNIIQSRNCSGK